MMDELPIVTQADVHAAKLYLQGTGPWKLDEIGIDADDYLVKCFARHRVATIEECAAAHYVHPEDAETYKKDIEALKWVLGYIGDSK